MLGAWSETAWSEPDAPRAEMFSGFEASDNYASGYVGGGYAFGKGLYAPGWRLRAVGAYGQYHYDGTLFDGTDYIPTRFDGEVGYGAALIGYQFNPGHVIFAVFGGVEVEDQHMARRSASSF